MLNRSGILPLSNNDYIEKYCALAEELFIGRYNFTFDSIEELSDDYQDKWCDITTNLNLTPHPLLS